MAKFVEKFNYRPIPRENVNGRRLYATPDGNKLPSVTTVLERTKPEEKKQALQEWRRRVGHAQAQAITTEAANRGTRMHTYLEHYVKTGELREQGSNPFGWASHAMAETVIEHGLKNVQEFWGVEIPLYFPELYAGTTDGAGIHMNEESILDYKQTNKPKRREWIEDYFLQLAAYALAHNEIYGTNIQKGVNLICTKDNLFQRFIFEGEEFKQAKYEWLKRVDQYYNQIKK